MPKTPKTPKNNYPDGKVDHDNREPLTLSVIADDERDLVAIEFGTTLAWFGMTPDQAIAIGKTLVQAAMKLKGLKAKSNAIDT